jgi:hypothetical protein
MGVLLVEGMRRDYSGLGAGWEFLSERAMRWMGLRGARQCRASTATRNVELRAIVSRYHARIGVGFGGEMEEEEVWRRRRRGEVGRSGAGRR